MRVGIALGSNLGDRLSHLQEARRRLLALHDGSGPFAEHHALAVAVERPTGRRRITVA